MSSYVSAALRRLVAVRADALCEYCLMHEDDAVFGCEFDHIISEKHGGEHPVMRERATEVQDVLHTPDEVRQSRSDPAVFLFYRAEVPGRWICAVAKRLNDEGFLITPYPTDAIKEGERVWSR